MVLDDWAHDGGDCEADADKRDDGVDESFSVFGEEASDLESNGTFWTLEFWERLIILWLIRMILMILAVVMICKMLLKLKQSSTILKLRIENRIFSLIIIILIIIVVVVQRVLCFVVDVVRVFVVVVVVAILQLIVLLH